MIQEYTPEQYNEIFSKLPQPLMDVLAVTSTNDKVFAIARKHRLQVDQMGTLNDIVMHILLGIIAAKDFLETVKKEIPMDPHEASLMVGEIDDEIFKPVREVMEKTFRGGAPYKPRTISTIDENDEEHLHLTKHDVLREIENPEPAESRKVESGKWEVGSEKPKEETPEISKTTEIEEYNQELTGNKIEIKKVESGKWEVGSEKKEEKPNEIPITLQIPKSISEIKLTSVTNIQQVDKIVSENKQNIPAETKTTIDPYREPIA